MCDYSLMAISNRLAVSAEELVIHRFEEGSVGLASALDLRQRQKCREARSRGFWPALKAFFNPPAAQPIPAVCNLPGARLLVRDIPAKQRHDCRLQKDVEQGVFTQITAAENTFPDAVLFQNGIEVLLQRFAEGQRVRVLTLSSGEDQGSRSRNSVGDPRAWHRSSPLPTSCGWPMGSSVHVGSLRRDGPFRAA